MLGRPLPLVALLLALAGTSCSTLKAEESRSATVVLFDVSKSTRDPAVRERYDRTFSMVLAHLRDAGGVLGADVIDDNPLVHGSLPIDLAFDQCGITDNALDCRNALEAKSKTAISKAREILGHQSQGTDIFGALELAAQFYEAYPGDTDRTLVVLSDMVQSANGMHLGTVEKWSPPAIDRLESEAPDVDLSGVRIYVVGAGATSVVGMTADQIRGIEAFWRSWLTAHGATVVFYGANLARYPIEGA
jgi:hypothetical protein